METHITLEYIKITRLTDFLIIIQKRRDIVKWSRVDKRDGRRLRVEPGGIEEVEKNGPQLPVPQFVVGPVWKIELWNKM